MVTGYAQAVVSFSLGNLLPLPRAAALLAVLAVAQNVIPIHHIMNWPRFSA
ncbi:MAG: hypothetical protein Q4D79_03760 [Propionibacteriaceae bacterium]|nr:hypothetical protein [Propionibacteriaceae bacterium]